MSKESTNVRRLYNFASRHLRNQEDMEEWSFIGSASVPSLERGVIKNGKVYFERVTIDPGEGAVIVEREDTLDSSCDGVIFQDEFDKLRLSLSYGRHLDFPEKVITEKEGLEVIELVYQLLRDEEMIFQAEIETEAL